MNADLNAAKTFMAAHGRQLDCRRLELLLDGGDPAAVLAAVDAYRNPDGGYGWGLEPDLRAPESQPGGALHALEAFADAAPATTPRALELCDWLATASLPDGGLPFALPITDPAGCAPWWQGPDAGESSLQITSIVAGIAGIVAGAVQVAAIAIIVRIGMRAMTRAVSAAGRSTRRIHRFGPSASRGSCGLETSSPIGRSGGAISHSTARTRSRPSRNDHIALAASAPSTKSSRNRARQFGPSSHSLLTA